MLIHVYNTAAGQSRCHQIHANVISYLCRQIPREQNIPTIISLPLLPVLLEELHKSALKITELYQTGHKILLHTCTADSPHRGTHSTMCYLDNLPKGTLADDLTDLVAVGDVVVHHLDVAPIVVVVAGVLGGSGHALHLLGLEPQEPHLRVVNDLLLLVAGQLVSVLLDSLLRGHGQPLALGVATHLRTCLRRKLQVTVKEGGVVKWWRRGHGEEF